MRRKAGCAPANGCCLRRLAASSASSRLFLLGPWAGIWIVKGNLSSSLTLKTLPLTDPYVLLQSLAAGHLPYRTALIGAAIVAAFYLLVGGRVYCSWVCPVNLVTDAAAWMRRRLGLKSGHAPDADTRYWLLAGTLIAAALTGTLAWEWVNPVSMLHRGLFFGFGLGGLVAAGYFPLRPAAGSRAAGAAISARWARSTACSGASLCCAYPQPDAMPATTAWTASASAPSRR